MKIDGKPGNFNRNQQLLIAQTAWQGSDERQSLWIVQCMALRDAAQKRPGEPCGHMYGMDASDFFQRRCPECQGGPPGLIVKPDDDEQQTAPQASPS